MDSDATREGFYMWHNSMVAGIGEVKKILTFFPLIRVFRLEIHLNSRLRDGAGIYLRGCWRPPVEEGKE
jgi:hypothetical protein